MSVNVHPSCGHSVCSQCYIETGDPRCVDGRETKSGEYIPRDNAETVGTALAIRARLPHLTLTEALTYADASTVQGRAFRGRSGFFGLGYDRETLARAFAWYFTLWASESRNHVRGVSLGICARLETEDSEVRRCYGTIVRGRNALLTGFERYARRCKRVGRYCPAWPGTRNMVWKGNDAATIRAWLDSQGLTKACEASVSDPSYFVYIPEVHS